MFCGLLCAGAFSARAHFPIHVGGSIALRIDNEVTVACFERTLSDLHQLGYTKIFRFSRR